MINGRLCCGIEITHRQAMSFFKNHESVGCRQSGCLWAQTHLIAHGRALLAPKIDGRLKVGQGDVFIHMRILSEYLL